MSGTARDITDALSSQRLGRALFIGAVVLLIFAVAQTIQFAQFTRTSDEAKAVSMPIDIVVLSFLSLFVGAVGAVFWSAPLRTIKAHEHFANKRYDQIILRDDPAFAMFNDRGKTIAKLNEQTRTTDGNDNVNAHKTE